MMAKAPVPPTKKSAALPSTMMSSGQLSTGNVFADLGIEDAEGALLKADLVIALGDVIKRSGLRQIEAAARLGTTQPKISLLLRGNTENVSVEKLLEYLTMMGRRVHIVVAPAEPTTAAKAEGPRVLLATKPWQPNLVPTTVAPPAQPLAYSYAAKKSRASSPGKVAGRNVAGSAKGAYGAAGAGGKKLAAKGSLAR